MQPDRQTKRKQIRTSQTAYILDLNMPTTGMSFVIVPCNGTDNCAGSEFDKSPFIHSLDAVHMSAALE